MPSIRPKTESNWNKISIQFESKCNPIKGKGLCSPCAAATEDADKRISASSRDHNALSPLLVLVESETLPHAVTQPPNAASSYYHDTLQYIDEIRTSTSYCRSQPTSTAVITFRHCDLSSFLSLQKFWKNSLLSLFHWQRCNYCANIVHKKNLLCKKKLFIPKSFFF